MSPLLTLIYKDHIEELLEAAISASSIDQDSCELQADTQKSRGNLALVMEAKLLPPKCF